MWEAQKKNKEKEKGGGRRSAKKKFQEEGINDFLYVRTHKFFFSTILTHFFERKAKRIFVLFFWVKFERGKFLWIM